MLHLKNWFNACRPKTLVAALIPVMIGGSVFWVYGDVNHRGSSTAYFFTLFSCLGFALAAQVLSNFSNDLGDSLRGADNAHRVGPSRAVANGLISRRAMKRGILIILILALVAGWPLGIRHPILFIPAVLALLLAMAYTLGPFPLAYHGLGDVFVVACFGLQATALTAFALYLEVGTKMASAMPWTPALIAGLGVGLLANNILIANNSRDLETDTAADKNTLVVRWGRAFAQAHYTFNILVGLGCLTWVFGWLPLLISPFAIWQIRGFRQAQEARDFIPFLAQAALLMLLTGVLCVTAACLGWTPSKV